MELARFKADDPKELIVSAIRRDGAAIVERYVDASVVDQILDDLREPFELVGRNSESDFNGYKTLRVNSILDVSKASGKVVGHEAMLAILDDLLLSACDAYRIGSCTAIEIHPGESGQTLHIDSIYPIRAMLAILDDLLLSACDAYRISKPSCTRWPHQYLFIGMVASGGEPISQYSARSSGHPTRAGAKVGGLHRSRRRAWLVSTRPRQGVGQRYFRGPQRQLVARLNTPPGDADTRTVCASAWAFSSMTNTLTVSQLNR